MMNCLFRACSAAILSRTGDFVGRSSCCGFSVPTWKTRLNYVGIKTVNLELLLTRLSAQCYSTGKVGGSKSRSKKLDPISVMEQEKDAFFVVRKGDVVGVYKSLSDCQAQVGSSVIFFCYVFQLPYYFYSFMWIQEMMTLMCFIMFEHDCLVLM